MQNVATLKFGHFAIVANQAGNICDKQIRTLRFSLRKILKRQAKLWINTRLGHLTVTKKPNETRLGKGKGTTKYWKTTTQSGKILAEIKGCKLSAASHSFDKVNYKLSIKTVQLLKPSRWVL